MISLFSRKATYGLEARKSCSKELIRMNSYESSSGCIEIESNEMDSCDVLSKKINLNKLQGIEVQVSKINTHLEKLEKLLLKLLYEKNKVSN